MPMPMLVRPRVVASGYNFLASFFLAEERCLTVGLGATGAKRPESVFSPRRSQRVPVGLEPATFGAKVWRSARSTIGSVVSGLMGWWGNQPRPPPPSRKKNLSLQRKKEDRRGVATTPERMGMGMDMGRERGPRDSIAGRAGRSNGHGRGHGHKG